MHSFKVIIVITLGLVLIVSISCSTPQEPEITDLTDIVQTDKSGRILYDDESDWQPRMGENEENYSVVPPFPNPVELNELLQKNITLLFSIVQYQDGTVSVKILDCNSVVIKSLKNRLSCKGRHAIGWNLRTDAGETITKGKYKVEIVVEINNQKYITTGDLLFQ